MELDNWRCKDTEAKDLRFCKKFANYILLSFYELLNTNVYE